MLLTNFRKTVDTSCLQAMAKLCSCCDNLKDPYAFSIFFVTGGLVGLTCDQTWWWFYMVGDFISRVEVFWLKPSSEIKEATPDGTLAMAQFHHDVIDIITGVYKATCYLNAICEERVCGSGGPDWRMRSSEAAALFGPQQFWLKTPGLYHCEIMWEQVFQEFFWKACVYKPCVTLSFFFVFVSCWKYLRMFDWSFQLRWSY